MLKTRHIQVGGAKSKTELNRPKVTKWKGVNMVRNHSFLATINEIIEFSKEMDLVKVGIIGDQHSGKTTLSMAISHSLHEMSKIPFAVKLFGKEQFLDFEKTLKKLQPANYILIFDDISFLGASASRKQIDMVKQAVTTIRHLPGGKDVKIITIMNYHYTLGLDKYLRTADFRYFTSVGSSEKENMEKQLGIKYSRLLVAYTKMRRIGIIKKYFSVRIGNKENLAYRWRNPFIPVLFFNSDTLRLIVTPTRQWLDPMGSKCSEALGENIASPVSLPVFVEKCETNFGLHNTQSAVKLLLYVNGFTTYGKHIVRALRAIERARKQEYITLEALALHYKLDITKTKLRTDVKELLTP